ncbi:MAG TPA: hypothetical protein VJ781_11645 [Pyrinomonadaceae bacterium]|nr:hypothetical protein [Pyrinomonadaceae bacterium]
MKKIMSVFLMLTMMAITMPLMSVQAAATTAPSPSAIEASGELAEMRPCPAGTYRIRRDSRNRRLVNALIAGGIGAAIGGGVGGGRGALLGAGAGSGGYLVYKYVKDRRGRCVPRYIRRG